MTTIVIMPGGFHPFHAGHYALYQSAQRAFPDAEVFVAATNDTSARPFPFPVKEKLAKLAGVEPGHFVQVKSPFKAEEITAKFDPARDTLIFVRSEKDSTKPPQAGGVKKDGSPAYLQPLLGAKRLEPFAKHAYMAYLPTVEFGPGMTSATEIRTAWPQLNEKRKTALVMSLYPRTQTNPQLAQTVVKLLDAAIGTQGVAEGLENFNGIQLSLEIQKDDEFVDDDDTDNQTIFVQATASGRELGQVVFAIDYDDKGMILVPQDLEVDERFRGQGIAATMYDYVKSKGYRIHRSYDQTPAGAGFWDKHKPGKDIWEQGVAEGSPIVVALAPIDVRNPKKAPQPYRNKGDIVPNTKPASTEKRGVKGRPGQRPMPKYDEGMAEAAKKCPPATQDIGINLENRQKAIDEYGYGPLNPDLPNTKFWMKKVDEWNLDSMEEAQQSLCGNCAAFDIRQDTLDCIAQGIDSDSPEDAEGVIDAGELGYCKFLKFKCASRRTCDAWVTGGPLQDKPVDENQGWAATYETNAQNFVGGMTAGYQRRENQPVAEQDLDYIEEKWSAKYKSSINCANPKGFSQKAHCAGRKK